MYYVLANVAGIHVFAEECMLALSSLGFGRSCKACLQKHHAIHTQTHPFQTEPMLPVSQVLVDREVFVHVGKLQDGLGTF